MRKAAGAALLAATALAQVTWAPRFEIGGAFPNLVLLAIVAITWTVGPRAGMVWACVGGVLLDLTSSGPVGPHALALLPGVYVIGFWTRNVERSTPVAVAATAAASTLLYSVVLVLAADLLGLPVPPAGVAAQLALTAAVYNAVLSPFAYELVRRFHSQPETA